MISKITNTIKNLDDKFTTAVNQKQRDQIAEKMMNAIARLRNAEHKAIKKDLRQFAK